MRINSYIVGCKCIARTFNIINYDRINSYIVGCKFALIHINLVHLLGINSYIVGCKLITEQRRLNNGSELIVT